MGWRPFNTAPRDGGYIIARVGELPERYEHWRGRPFVIRYDEPFGGWSMFPGFGGAPDEWFAAWAPLPEANGPDGGEAVHDEPKGQDPA